MELDRYHHALRAVRHLDQWTGSRKMMHGETVWRKGYYELLLDPITNFIGEYAQWDLSAWFGSDNAARLREKYYQFRNQVHDANVKPGDTVSFLMAATDDEFGLDCPFIQIGRFVLELRQDFSRHESEWINRRSPEVEAERERRARLIG